MYSKLILALILGSVSLTVLAQAERPTGTLVQTGEQAEEGPGGQGDSLAELASLADLIAVVRVKDTQYEMTRDFPSSGYAILEVLIGYKGAERGAVIEVTEKGLGEDKCYYPGLGTWQFEGDRFLVFLRHDKGKDVYRGSAPGCRLPVLVTADNRYALRYPVRGLRLDDPGVVEQIDYVDPAAFVDAADFTSAGINELENFHQARRVQSEDPFAPPSLKYVYTRGIPISKLRELLKLK